MKMDLNTRIFDAINTAFEKKVLPSMKKAFAGQNSAKNTNLDLWSDGPHPSNFSQVHRHRDFRSNELHPENVSQAVQDVQKDFSGLVAMSSNRVNHRRENSVDSNQSDEDGYDNWKECYFQENDLEFRYSQVLCLRSQPC